MKSIAVIGNGFVGGSLTTVFAERACKVYVYDKANKLAPGGESLGASNIESFVNRVESKSQFSNVYFVCLPTPMARDGSADVSIVESVLKELSDIPGERIAVVKSTVPPGTTKSWNDMFKQTGLSVIHNPEFLREASALDDMRNQDRILLGGPKKSVNVVRDVYKTIFPKTRIYKTSSTNTEFVKYVTNCSLAIKLSFANEVFQLVNKFDPEEADFDRIIELTTLDQRLGKSHWQVPGPMPADDGTNRLLPGWAGSCFVKDANALIYLGSVLGIDMKTLRGAWEKNLEVRPGKDWEKLIGRAISS